MFCVFKLTIETITGSNSLNSLINRLEKGNLIIKGHFGTKYGFDLKIDAQKNGDLQP